MCDIDDAVVLGDKSLEELPVDIARKGRGKKAGRNAAPLSWCGYL
jgi:hypothetical protein